MKEKGLLLPPAQYPPGTVWRLCEGARPMTEHEWYYYFLRHVNPVTLDELLEQLEANFKLTGLSFTDWIKAEEKYVEASVDSMSSNELERCCEALAIIKAHRKFPEMAEV